VCLGLSWDAQEHLAAQEVVIDQAGVFRAEDNADFSS